MAKSDDLKGQKFGKYTVINRASNSQLGKSKWLCKCDCGKERIVFGGNLKRGLSKSCGCLNLEQLSNRKSHGMSRTKEHNVWANIKMRCHNPNDLSYNNYGGRGIKVCDRWLNSFDNFLKDMGNIPTKNHSIDRINNNRDYEPSNCRWATKSEQARNTRANHWIEYNGERMIITDWARKFGVTRIDDKLKNNSFEELYIKYIGKASINR